MPRKIKKDSFPMPNAFLDLYEKAYKRGFKEGYLSKMKKKGEKEC